MTLEPLLKAAPVIQLHAAAATAAFMIGLVQLVARKGVVLHRVLGWTWVVLMLLASLSAFFIHEIKLWGAWSPVHLLAALTLVGLCNGVWQARRHDVQRHRRAMTGLFVFALLVAGLATLAPGRIMHEVVFGR